MMSKKKTIIVGIDGSKATLPVLEAAATMAARLGWDVVLMTAISDHAIEALVTPELASLMDGQLHAQAEREAEALLEDAAKKLRPGVLSERIVERGPAWRVLCDAAKIRNAALIVVGANRHGKLDRLLGTTAAKVTNRAGTSVLVVRQAEKQPVPLSFDRIVVGHDGSERAGDVVASALHLAEPSSGHVMMVRAVEKVPRELVGPTASAGEVEEWLIRDVQAALQRECKTFPSRVSSECRARLGSAVDVVLESARERNATLIVLGSHGFDPIDRVLGTNAGRIVDEAEGSVLIVRNGGV
jgi:universal stress protein F